MSATRAAMSMAALPSRCGESRPSLSQRKIGGGGVPIFRLPEAGTLPPQGAKTHENPDVEAGFLTERARADRRVRRPGRGRRPRSEEHTSELQSLMRISYAVFCLKK